MSREDGSSRDLEAGLRDSEAGSLRDSEAGLRNSETGWWRVKEIHGFRNWQSFWGGEETDC